LKVVKLSDQVYEKLKELADKKGVAINNVIEELLNVYFGSPRDKPIKKIYDKDIELIYNAKCRKCGREIPAGEPAHYIRYEYEDGSSSYVIYCLDCWYSSSALAKQYLTKKKLEATIRGLKKEADKLVEEIQLLEKQIDDLKIQLDVRQALAKIREELDFLLSMQFITREDYNKALAKLEELLLRVEELEAKTRVTPVAQVEQKLEAKKTIVRKPP
jgi:DNA repair exonuclease SbcCD ATPase subunit